MPSLPCSCCSRRANHSNLLHQFRYVIRVRSRPLSSMGTLQGRPRTWLRSQHLAELSVCRAVFSQRSKKLSTAGAINASCCSASTLLYSSPFLQFPSRRRCPFNMGCLLSALRRCRSASRYVKATQFNESNYSSRPFHSFPSLQDWSCPTLLCAVARPCTTPLLSSDVVGYTLWLSTNLTHSVVRQL